MDNHFVDKCPCCGGCAATYRGNNELLRYFGYETYYAQCSDCGLSTTYGDYFEVIRRWNRRDYKNGVQ